MDARFRQTKSQTHRAVFDHQYRMLQRLLRAGHDVIEQDCHGNTPLHLACQRGYLDMIELLLRYGALPAVPNDQGWAALSECVAFGNRDIISRVWFAHRRVISCTLQARKDKIMNELAVQSADFRLVMNWKFSSWIPFTSR
jgi:hypothetical protein